MIIYFLSNLAMGGGGGSLTVQDIREALAAKLFSIPEVTAIVGTAIYPLVVPMTRDFSRDGPALTYEIPSNPRGQVLGGSDGTSDATVTLKLWGYTYGTASAMTSALFSALNGPPGVWGNGTCSIISVTQHDEGDDVGRPFAASDQWIPYIESEYLVRYRVPNPTLS